MKIGAFPGQLSEEVDAEVEQELSACMDEQIRYGIRHGKLKPPKDDDFLSTKK